MWRRTSGLSSTALLSKDTEIYDWNERDMVTAHPTPLLNLQASASQTMSGRAPEDISSGSLKPRVCHTSPGKTALFTVREPSNKHQQYGNSGTVWVYFALNHPSEYGNCDSHEYPPNRRVFRLWMTNYSISCYSGQSTRIRIIPWASFLSLRNCRGDLDKSDNS